VAINADAALIHARRTVQRLAQEEEAQTRKASA
jgi:hypothetical protein